MPGRQKLQMKYLFWPSPLRSDAQSESGRLKLVLKGQGLSSLDEVLRAAWDRISITKIRCHYAILMN